MELGKTRFFLLFTFFSIALWGTSQGTCVPKKKVLFEDVTPNIRGSSMPESPPQPQKSQPPPSSPPAPTEDTKPAGLGLGEGLGVGLGAGALKNAMNPPLDALKNALNPSLGAVQSAMNPDISKICDQADYKDLCASTIGPLFTGKTDIFSVMDMMIKGCEAGAAEAKAEAAKLKAKADASTQSGFDSCMSNFDDALDYLNQGLTALQAKDISTAQTQLSAAISMTSTCDDNFSGEPVPGAASDNPMEKIDENLINMIGNALAILDKNKALF